jgi:Domain of unknown function (DUF1707)
MTEPGDEIAAGTAGRGRLRASHADREQVIDTLKAAFVQGMLDKDEFDLRVGQAFASRTYADLAAVTADIPAGLPAAQPPKPARAHDQQPVLRPGLVIMAATLLCAGAWEAVIQLSPNGGDNGTAVSLILITTLVYFLIVIISGGYMLALRHEKRRGGQLPRRPVSGSPDQASQRPPSADPAGQLPPIDHGQQYTAQAARSRLFRPPLPGWRSLRRCPA